MAAVGVQVHCPFCNAVQSRRDDKDYVCDFCLQAFSLVEADKEESRLIGEIKSWIEQKLGAAASTMGNVDSSSRSFIFQQKILPELRRDVDRATEIMGSHGQHALVQTPVRAAVPSGQGPHPLVAYRQEILALKNLRARLSSQQVTSFAIGEDEKSQIEAMDRKLSDLLHLSNVADAVATVRVAGYTAARRNLDALLESLRKQLAGVRDAAVAAFLAGVKKRYECLSELCRICEEVVSPNPISGTTVAERLDRLVATFGEAAHEIEASNHSPADAMPLVIGVNQESASCRALAHWLRTYDAVAGSRLPFTDFVAEVEAVMGTAAMALDETGDLLKAFAFVVRVARGEIAIAAVDDFSWVDQWAENARGKKSLGLFGTAEEIAGVEKFFVAAWIADVSYSQSSGTVFKDGVEGKSVLLVEASAPEAAKVVFQEGFGNALDSAATAPRTFGGSAIALPRSTAARAQSLFLGAARGKQGILNPRVQVRPELILLPVALAHFTSKKGKRDVIACLAGRVPIAISASADVEATRQLVRRFS